MDEDDDEIFQLTWETIQLFERSRDIPGFAKNDWLEEKQSQFNWWAYNIKADKTGHSSLDYRVRNRADIKSVIVGLINGISQALDETLRAADRSSQSQDHINRNTLDSQSAEMSNSKRRKQFPSVGEMDVNSPELRVPSSENDRVVLEPRFYIGTNLDLLNSLSVALVKSGTRLRHERADAALSMVHDRYSALWNNLRVLLLIGAYEQALISSVTAMEFNQHISSTVAILIKAWLRDAARITSKQKDIMRAVVIRHNRILYARDAANFGPADESKAKKVTGKSPRITRQSFAAQNTIGEQSGSEATELQQTAGMSSQQEISRRSLPNRASRYLRSIAANTYSQTATDIGSSLKAPFQNVTQLSDQQIERFQAITEITRIGLLQEYPSRPQKVPGRGYFKCPYCSKEQSVEYLESKSRWRGHVAHDLLPYTCIFDSCRDSTEYYPTSEEWIHHMKQAHSVTRWICDECPLDDKFSSPLFETVQDWHAHCSSMHKMDAKLQNHKPELKMSERKVLDAVQCPLCPRSAPINLQEDDHVANHLHSFSLRAIPWEGNVESDESWTVLISGFQQKSYSGAMRNPRDDGYRSSSASSVVDEAEVDERQPTSQKSLTLAVIARKAKLEEAGVDATDGMEIWLENAQNQDSDLRETDDRQGESDSGYDPIIGEEVESHQPRRSRRVMELLYRKTEELRSEIEEPAIAGSSQATSKSSSTGPEKADVTSQPEPRGRKRERKTQPEKSRRVDKRKAETGGTFVYFSAYRLSEQSLRCRLKVLFPTFNISIDYSDDQYIVYIPRDLTPEEKNEINMLRSSRVHRR